MHYSSGYMNRVDVGKAVDYAKVEAAKLRQQIKDGDEEVVRRSERYPYDWETTKARVEWASKRNKLENRLVGLEREIGWRRDDGWKPSSGQFFVGSDG
jgi:hypothetical protein